MMAGTPNLELCHFDGIFTSSKSELGLSNDLTIKVALMNWFLARLRETFGLCYFVSKIVLANCKKRLKVGLRKFVWLISDQSILYGCYLILSCCPIKFHFRAKNRLCAYISAIRCSYLLFFCFTFLQDVHYICFSFGRLQLFWAINAVQLLPT